MISVLKVDGDHTGIGNYAIQLSKNLNAELLNEPLSNKHYYIDFLKRIIFNKKINDVLIKGSIFSSGYTGRYTITVIHDFFYADYKKYMDFFGRNSFKFSYLLSKIQSDYFVAISNYTSSKIHVKNKKVIYPFVENFGQRKTPVFDYIFDSTFYANKQPEMYEKFSQFVLNKNKDIRIIKLGSRMKNSDVFFAGNIPFEQVKEYYKVSRLFVSFSENEGFGYPLAQSLLIGMPVMVWKNPTYIEILGNSFPYFITPEMSMQEIYELGIQAVDDTQLSKENQQMINEKLNPEILKEQWFDLIKEVITNGK